MSVGDVIDSVNMVLLAVIAVLLVRVLLRQKKVKPLEGSLPTVIGEIAVDGNGRRWMISGRTLDISSTGKQHLRLDLVEVQS